MLTPLRKLKHSDGEKVNVLFHTCGNCLTCCLSVGKSIVHIFQLLTVPTSQSLLEAANERKKN